MTIKNDKHLDSDLLWSSVHENWDKTKVDYLTDEEKWKLWELCHAYIEDLKSKPVKNTVGDMMEKVDDFRLVKGIMEKLNEDKLYELCLQECDLQNDLARYEEHE